MSVTVEYAGFWRRLGANLVDMLCLVPLVALYLWLSYHSRLGLLLYLFPYFLIGWSYPIFFHARFEQTPGKMALKIKLLDTTLKPIRAHQAFARSSVDVFLGLLYIAGMGVALFRMSDSQFVPSSSETWKLLESLNPLPTWFGWLGQAWFWSEIFVLLTNKRKRAIHDFIAHTVVVTCESLSTDLKTTSAT